MDFDAKWLVKKVADPDGTIFRTFSRIPRVKTANWLIPTIIRGDREFCLKIRDFESQIDEFQQNTRVSSEPAISSAKSLQINEMWSFQRIREIMSTKLEMAG